MQVSPKIYPSMKTVSQRALPCLFLATSLLLGGCVASIGNRQPERAGTLGQELIDLQKAKEANAITEAEYQQQRAKLLNPEAKR